MPDKSGSHFPKLVRVRCYCQLLKSAILQRSEPTLVHFDTFSTLLTLLTACHLRDFHFPLLKTKRSDINVKSMNDQNSPVANAFQKHALESVLMDDPLVHSCATFSCRVRCVKDCLDHVLLKGVLTQLDCILCYLCLFLRYIAAMFFVTWKCHHTSSNTTTVDKRIK